MRADAHYVEQLTAPRRLEAARSAVMDVEAAAPEPVDRERIRPRILARLAEDLATIGSAATLLAGDASPMARRLNTDLIRAEAWRASWLLHAQVILDGLHRGRPRPRQIGTVLERIRQGFAPECRLNAMALQVHASDWNATVPLDETGVLAGATGAVIATLGLIGRFEGASLTLTADAQGGELRTIDVAQDAVPVPPSAMLRFFDPNWSDRPGGWLAGIGAATARTVAQLHGGTAALLAGERRGTVVRLTLARP
jgi:hypothetical protein